MTGVSILRSGKSCVHYIAVITERKKAHFRQATGKSNYHPTLTFHETNARMGQHNWNLKCPKEKAQKLGGKTSHTHLGNARNSAFPGL